MQDRYFIRFNVAGKLGESASVGRRQFDAICANLKAQGGTVDISRREIPSSMPEGRYTVFKLTIIAA